MRNARAAVFWLIVLAPFVLMTRRGQRLSPGLPAAARAAVLVGFLTSLVATAIFLVTFNGDWGLFLFFFLIGVHAIMGVAESLTVALALGRHYGYGPARFLCALLGAVVGHVLWAVALFAIWPVGTSAGELTALVLFVLAPSAVLGGCGAAMAAALVPPERRA